MAPIPFKNIVSVSSEDELNPARNLLDSSSGKKWLCSLQDKSGRSEVIIELAKKARITSIEISNFGSAQVEVLVGTTDSPDNFITLLPTSMMMTPADSKAGRNKTRSRIYDRERLSSVAVSSKWNLVKIRCLQRYNPESQFGLQNVALYADCHTPQTPVVSQGARQHRLLTPPHTPVTPHTLSHVAHRTLSLPNNPRTPSSRVKTEKTPSRRLKRSESDDEEDFEFSGVEKQSRLFRNCVRGKTSTGKEFETNPILARIRDRLQKESETSSDTSLYQRKKLLKTELPKAENSVNFVSSYQSKKHDIKVSHAWNKIASHDNDYEIGEEPEKTWGLDRYKGRPKGRSGKRQKREDSSNGGWFGKKRKKLDKMISECKALLEGVDGDDKVEERDRVAIIMNDDHKKDGSAVCDGGQSFKEEDCDKDFRHEETDTDNMTTNTEQQMMIECPLCGEMFPSYVVDVHASTCGEEEGDHPVMISSGSGHMATIPIVID